MTATLPVTAGSRVRLHQLAIRPDGDSCVVGRTEIGVFVAVPPVAVDAIRLLDGHRSVDDVRRRLHAAHGRDVDVAALVTDLAELGFVTEIDGRTLATPEPVRPSVRWLRPRHVRWTLHPAVPVVLLVLAVAAVVTVLAVPHTLPTFRDLLWSPRGSAVIAGNAAIIWTVVLVHELAHLVTARGAGVPGRISLGTRLQFLVAQTDVTGVWAAPRRVRITVYLAGMAVAVAVAAVAVLARAWIGPTSGAGKVLGAVSLIAATSLAPQFLVFMRTDLYFVLQDLSGCRNLYADGGAYLRYRGRLLASMTTGRRWRARRAAQPVDDGEPRVDPSAALPARERRGVRWYAVLLLVGTAACLAVAATVNVPVAVMILARAVRDLAVGAGLAQRLDGLVAIVVVGGVWLLWARAWLQRHGGRVRAWWRGLRHQVETTPEGR